MSEYRPFFDAHEEHPPTEDTVVITDPRIHASWHLVRAEREWFTKRPFWLRFRSTERWVRSKADVYRDFAERLRRRVDRHGLTTVPLRCHIDDIVLVGSLSSVLARLFMERDRRKGRVLFGEHVSMGVHRATEKALRDWQGEPSAVYVRGMLFINPSLERIRAASELAVEVQRSHDQEIIHERAIAADHTKRVSRKTKPILQKHVRP